MNLETIKVSLGRMFTQLGSGSGTEGEDCGCLADINATTWGSHHKVGPDYQNAVPAQYKHGVAAWVRVLRAISQNPRGPMMVRGDIYEALKSDELGDRFKAAGVRRLKVTYQYGIEFWKVRQWLSSSSDHAVILAIDYSVARDSGCQVGSESFGGGHAVFMTGCERRKVRVTRNGKTTYIKRWKTILGDSLMDGRSKPSGGTYPKGWLIHQFYKYRDAAGAFGTTPNGTPRPIGKGRAVAIFVERFD